VAGRYIDVVVEEHPEIPEGCEMRFHAIGDDRVVRRIRYEPLSGPEGDFGITAARGEPARAAAVDDSGAGTCVLIYGDAHGLRLQRLTDAGESSDEPLAEPYLLLAKDSILE
jgi:hypothetical protein